ncbi:MAG: hypothetical protein LBQ89_02745 [Treponema sp.]|nr:hypothetical protein [Treponema sp.]
MTKEDAARDYMIEMSRLLHLNNESIMNEIYKAFVAGAEWYRTSESVGDDEPDG